MAWVKKTKVVQGGNDEEILMPDLQQILVGVNGDQVLLYQRLFTNWGLKSRNAVAGYTLKSKITP